MTTRVSLGLAGLGVTVQRKDRTATDLLLTSDGHPHTPQLFVPKRHFIDSELPWDEDGDYVVIDIQRCDVSVKEMLSGAVELTRGLRKPIGGGKRQPKPDKVDDWRDVTWAVDFDHIEKHNGLNPKCLEPDPLKAVAARVHMSGGFLDGGVPRHACLREEKWRLRNSQHNEVDLQVVADTLYHHWDSHGSELTVSVKPFGGSKPKTVSLVAVGGVIAGVRIQSTPPDHGSGNEPCGKGTMEHHGHLYSVLKDVSAGTIELVADDREKTGFTIDETRRCGRGVISE